MKQQPDITAYIPQRAPFVMIDEVLQAEDTVSRCAFTVRADNVLVENGLLSPSGLVENMAQTAAAGTGCKAQQEGQTPAVGFIGALKNLIIKELPAVGEQLTTEVTFLNQVMNAHIVQGRVFTGKGEIASCELKIFLQEA